MGGGDIHGHADGRTYADRVVAFHGHKADVRFLVLGGEGVRVEALRDDGVGVKDGLQQLGGLVTFADVDEVRALWVLSIGGGDEKNFLPRAISPLALRARAMDFFSPSVATQFLGSPMGVGILMGALALPVLATDMPAGRSFSEILWRASWALTPATVFLGALARAVLRPVSMASLPLHFSRAKYGPVVSGRVPHQPCV